MSGSDRYTFVPLVGGLLSVFLVNSLVPWAAACGSSGVPAWCICCAGKSISLGLSSCYGGLSWVFTTMGRVRHAIVAASVTIRGSRFSC